MRTMRKRPWKTATSHHRIVLLSRGLVGYLLLERHDDASRAYEGMQVEGGKIEAVFSPHQVASRLGLYVFDRLSLVGGHMGQGIAVRRELST